MKAKITERGWPGHFIAASSCVFRRNTLIEYKDTRIVVSTVGDCRVTMPGENHPKTETIGYNRYYETMAFHAEFSGHYWDAEVSREIQVNSNTAIPELYHGVDNDANEMHEAAVKEIAEKLERGEVGV